MTTSLEIHQIPDLLFTQAKRWFATGLLLRLSALAAGVSGLLPQVAGAAPYAVACFAALAEAVSWRSDVLKGKAERSLRLLELQDGMGIRAAGEDVADLLVSVNGRPASERTSYFSSGSPEGARRLVENLRESAWWTRNLATSMARIITFVTSLVLAASIVFLIWSLTYVDEQPSRAAAARVATALLMTVISLGFVKLTYAYRILASRADAASRGARTLIQSGTTESAAISAVHDYQLARATGPLIPDALYGLKAGTLRKLWSTVAGDHVTGDRIR